MAADDLTKPLGLAPPRRPRAWRWALAIGAGAVVVVAGAGGAWLAREPGPTATAVIAAPAPGDVSLADRTASTTAPTDAGSTAKPVDTGGAGLTEVKPADGGLADVGKVIIYDPSQPAPLRLSALPDPALVEMSGHGQLPRIAADGRRPLDAYARPSDADDRNARIAIVIGGVGIDPDGSARAIADLPGAVTLALAPYGNGLDRTLAAARSAGHEILLQVPLEPYSYPQTDPGPQTLTTEAPVAENLDRLHWLMSRVTNYVGVVNYMGARFTSEAPALAPVLDEIGKRGLLYLDDGSSARSVAETVADGRAPFVKADLVLDTDLSAPAIDARLRELSAIARERGYAVATATAFPTTIDRVAAFAKAAADRNIILVPISALVGGGRT
jgi:polysaccharide deacetylase 2 family uncharacterized protein YibQ